MEGGDGTTDEVAAILLTKPEIANLLYLSLDGTAISEPILNRLELKSLRRLYLDDNVNLTLRTALQFKKHHPKCEVLFNSRTVDPAPRMDHAALELKKDRLYLNGNPFTAYAYEFDTGNQLLRVLDVEDGATLGESTDLLRPKAERRMYTSTV